VAPVRPFIAAYELAKAGKSVLLVDAEIFRRKNMTVDGLCHALRKVFSSEVLILHRLKRRIPMSAYH
jgi:hypothetical protein